MFQLTMCEGLNFGFPDVCLTPTPVGPIPIPYPNISMSTVALPPTVNLNILVDGMPTLNMVSEIPISIGDEPGVNLGLMSGMVMGPTEFILGSETLMLEGVPAVKLTSLTAQNGELMNAPGMSLTPSQVTMIVLS